MRLVAARRLATLVVCGAFGMTACSSDDDAGATTPTLAPSTTAGATATTTEARAATVAEAADVAISAAAAGTNQRFDRDCVETAFAKVADKYLQGVIAGKPNPTQEQLQPVLFLMIPCLLDSSTATSA